MRRPFVPVFASMMLACGAVRGAVTFTDIADTNTTAPGQSAKFTQFNLPSLSGNDLTFLAFYSGGFGQYTSTVSPVANSKLIDTSNNIGTHGAVAGLGNSGISASDVTLEVLYGSGAGLYHGTVGTTGVTKIIETGTTAPGQTTAFSDFGGARPSGTHVAFEGFYNNDNGSGIYSSTFTGTSLTKIVDENSTAPGQSTFTSFATPAVSGNNIVFWGQASTDGIYAGTVGTAGATKIADHTDSAPGHSNFSGFTQDPSVSGNRVAFEGVFSGKSGIYSATIGTPGITKVAETGDTAPGTGTTFSSVQSPSASGNSVAFLGDYTIAGSPKTGVFIETDGVVTDVLKSGDSLFGGTVQSLSLGNSGFDRFRLAFNYHLTNGQVGVLVADLPEPGTLGLGLSCFAWALIRRPRRHA